MSKTNERTPRRRPTRTRRASKTATKTTGYVVHHSSTNTAAAREHYHREKARRAGRARPADHPLEQARRAYEELLAKDAERARGGRPKKVVTTSSSKRPHSE